MKLNYFFLLLKKIYDCKSANNTPKIIKVMVKIWIFSNLKFHSSIILKITFESFDGIYDLFSGISKSYSELEISFSDSSVLEGVIKTKAPAF